MHGDPPIFLFLEPFRARLDRQAVGAVRRRRVRVHRADHARGVPADVREHVRRAAAH